MTGVPFTSSFRLDTWPEVMEASSIEVWLR